MSGKIRAPLILEKEGRYAAFIRDANGTIFRECTTENLIDAFNALSSERDELRDALEKLTGSILSSDSDLDSDVEECISNARRVLGYQGGKP